MPIPQKTVTPTQFDALQNNITNQRAQFLEASDLAESGLTLVAQLDEVAPSVDLVASFAAHFTNLEQFDSTANFVTACQALNNHLINRGTTQQAGDNANTRLNRWLAGGERVNEVDLTPVQVTQTYADLSAAAGFTIEASNILP
jgi:hypothetical protein